MLAPATLTTDAQILDALKRGDEAAFAELVERHQSLMLRIASRYVRSRAVAEEVVQETWLGVMCGLDRFEGRASLKTWIFRILTNRALSRAEREGRVIPFSCLGSGADGEPAVDAAELPERQHHVIVMRDVEGWSAADVCAALAISEANQRVLLHRARSKVRRALEAYVDVSLGVPGLDGRISAQLAAR